MGTATGSIDPGGEKTEDSRTASALLDRIDLPDYVPARILNEFVYCPRLAYLEWVDREFQENADTAEGTFVHRRVNRERGAAAPGPEPGEEGGVAPPPSTSVTVSSRRLGLIARIDLVEAGTAEETIPVEYKRGAPRSGRAPLWEPEAVQLCAQALLLRDSGKIVPHAEVYFAGTRTRHRVDLTDGLIERTLGYVAKLRRTARRGRLPPPLSDSPKCPRCSLVGICLPDETLSARGELDARPRRLIAPDSPAAPLYVTEQGAKVTVRRGRVALVKDDKELASRRLLDVSQISVFGNVTVGSALMRRCFSMGIPVIWFTYGGWLKGFATTPTRHNADLRVAQHRAARLGRPDIAGSMVSGKVRNSRTLLRRNGERSFASTLAQLTRIASRGEGERSMDRLLGLEGAAARLYFERFGDLVAGDAPFDFKNRNRRPPIDPVNCLLSFLYALLLKDATAAALAVGFDPFVGIYHRHGFGRPALALDLMEEFRPLIADSTALALINGRQVSPGDFLERAGAVSLTERGRKKVVAGYERRVRTEFLHPLFRYRVTYRRALEVQARLLASVLLEDSPSYRPVVTR